VRELAGCALASGPPKPDKARSMSASRSAMLSVAFDSLAKRCQDHR
jgi:hypothetical protein